MKFNIISKIKRNIGTIFFIAIAILSTIPLGYCADDLASSISQWLPTIITFAMLGMVLGLLKKFGKF